MGLPIEVKGIIYSRENELKFLMFKQSENNGGAWENLTATLQEEENLKGAIKRRIKDASGIGPGNIKNISKTVYEEQYKEKELWITEYIYAVELSKTQDPKISEEYSSFVWVDYKEAEKLLGNDKSRKDLKIAYDFIEENIRISG